MDREGPIQSAINQVTNGRTHRDICGLVVESNEYLGDDGGTTAEEYVQNWLLPLRGGHGARGLSIGRRGPIEVLQGVGPDQGHIFTDSGVARGGVRGKLSWVAEAIVSPRRPCPLQVNQPTGASGSHGN